MDHPFIQWKALELSHLNIVAKDHGARPVQVDEQLLNEVFQLRHARRGDLIRKKKASFTGRWEKAENRKFPSVAVTPD